MFLEIKRDYGKVSLYIVYTVNAGPRYWMMLGQSQLLTSMANLHKIL